MAERPSILGSSATVSLDTNMLDSHIQSMSVPTLWEKSYLCPCRQKETRQPNQACPHCHGRGVAYLPPKPVRIIITSQEKGISNTDLGLIDTGTAIGTPERGVRLAFRDRVTVPPAKVSQSFIFDVTQRRVDHGFYMVYDVHEIEFATTMQGELYEGTDFTFDKRRNLFFPKEHLIGENISINISTTLRYMVADLLKEHRYALDNQRNLVQTVQKLLLKREDIFIDKEAFDLGDDGSIGELLDAKRPPKIDGLNGFFGSGGL